MKLHRNEFLATIQSHLDQNSIAINEIKEKQIGASTQELPFLNKVLSILNETYQTLFNLQFFRKELINNIEQHIQLIESYLKDPEFKSISLNIQSFYYL